MATHNIFNGGARTVTTFPPSMFPSREVGPDDTMEADNRRGPIDFSLTRQLVWKDHEKINKGVPNDAFSAGLSQYIECLETPIADGDILNTHIMPKFSELQQVWIWVEAGATGLTADLQVRGNAASVGGVQVIQAGVDLGTEGSQLITLPTGIYFDQNDMFQMVLAGVDQEQLLCSNIHISPVVREFCRGRY